jgi:hypothetical protein
MSDSHDSNWKTRLVDGGFPNCSFDIEFWQEQGDEAIFSAAWEMVELSEELRTGNKPVFQKTVTLLKHFLLDSATPANAGLENGTTPIDNG